MDQAMKNALDRWITREPEYDPVPCFRCGGDINEDDVFFVLKSRKNGVDDHAYHIHQDIGICETCLPEEFSEAAGVMEDVIAGKEVEAYDREFAAKLLIAVTEVY